MFQNSKRDSEHAIFPVKRVHAIEKHSESNVVFIEHSLNRINSRWLLDENSIISIKHYGYVCRVATLFAHAIVAQVELYSRMLKQVNRVLMPNLWSVSEVNIYSSVVLVASVLEISKAITEVSVNVF